VKEDAGRVRDFFEHHSYAKEGGAGGKERPAARMLDEIIKIAKDAGLDTRPLEGLASFLESVRAQRAELERELQRLRERYEALRRIEEFLVALVAPRETHAAKEK